MVDIIMESDVLLEVAERRGIEALMEDTRRDIAYYVD